MNNQILASLDAAIALLTTSQDAGQQDPSRYEETPFVCESGLSHVFTLCDILPYGWAKVEM